MTEFIVRTIPVVKQARSALLGALALVALAACSTGPRLAAPDLEQQMATAELMAVAGRPAEAAERFEALAAAYPDHAAELHARAADAWLGANDRPRAEAALLRAQALPADAVAAGSIAVVVAELARLDGDPAAALNALAFDASALPRGLQARVLLARADAESALGMPLVAVVDLTARAAVLDDDESRRANAQRLWRVLINARGALDATTLPLNSPPEAQRWVELALLVRGAWQDPAGARERIETWRDGNDDHPGAVYVLPGLLDQLKTADRYPERIALLLPLTGRYLEPAEAVRDGFLAAHYAAGALPAVKVFDTTDYPGGSLAALAAARAWGAGFVVGPLTREGVTELAAAGPGEPPLLALNYLDGGAATPERFWQFGLLPEGEAEAIAERAMAQGLMRAAVLFPRGDWGTRMATAFEQRFAALGGVVLASQQYDPTVAEKDFSTAIMRLLNLDTSALRSNLLTAAFGAKVISEPRRRRDLDFVFVAAREREAPLLRAQLRFHRAADLPTFATSQVWRADGSRETDLDGLEFADMPWTISADPALVAQRAQLAALWPEGLARQGRLYALGLDAYRLIPLFANLPAPLAEPVPAATGILSLGAGQRVRRELDWARFVDGAPVPVPVPLAPPVPEAPPPP
jgi:outer membrane PBP1 activator LpoA protein